MKRLSPYILLLAALSFMGCTHKDHKQRTVLAIPVYGQSLALGEAAIRVTDLDSLALQTHHLVLTENLDEEFGYLSDTHFKQWAKKMLHDRHRAFELSIYGMSEVVTKYFESKGYGDSVMICTFPGGQGATSITGIGKGSAAYVKFLDEIKSAYDNARSRGWNYEVPAFCWMQGEDDVVWKTSFDYKKDLKQFSSDLNRDVKEITKQRRDVVCISYQTNCLTLAKDFKTDVFQDRSTYVPQGQLDLIANDPLFLASGPTYPYNFLENSAHIDGVSQKILGYLEGLAVVRLLEGKESKGLIPERYTLSGDTAIIKFNIPSPPLVLDTVRVSKAANYGFSVIDSQNNNILDKVMLNLDQVKLSCKRSPLGCKVRYAVNGTKGITGYKKGSRGNLRDSQGKELIAKIGKRSYPLDNWAYQFDVLMK